jgi:hypothetical protein
MNDDTRTCAGCGRALPVAADQTDPGLDECGIDSRGLVAANEYVCGACQESAWDAMAAAE